MEISSEDRSGNKIIANLPQDQRRDAVNREIPGDKAAAESDSGPMDTEQVADHNRPQVIPAPLANGEAAATENDTSDFADTSNQIESTSTGALLDSPVDSPSDNALESSQADSSIPEEENDGEPTSKVPNGERSIPPAVKRTGLAAKVLAKREASEVAAELQRTTGSNADRKKTSSISSSASSADRDTQRTTGSTPVGASALQKSTGTTPVYVDLSQKSTGTTPAYVDTSQKSTGSTFIGKSTRQKPVDTADGVENSAQNVEPSSPAGLPLESKHSNSVVDCAAIPADAANFDIEKTIIGDVQNEIPLDEKGRKIISPVDAVVVNEASVPNLDASGSSGIRSSVNAKGVKSRDNAALQVSTFQKLIISATRRPLAFDLSLLCIIALTAVLYLHSLQTSSHETEKAADLLAHARYGDALKVLDKALLSSRTADAYVLRGRAYELLNNSKHSFEDYRSAIKLQPKNVEALRGLGQLSLNKKDYKAAIGYFEQCLSSSTDEQKRSSNVQNSLASALMLNGEFRRAAEIYEEIGSKRNDSTALIEGARCLLSAQKTEQAISVLNKVLKEQPKSVDALTVRAACYEQIFDKTQALNDLNQAVKIQPKAPAPVCARGAMFAHFKDFSAAASDFNKALALDPNFYEAYIERANSYLLQGDFNKCAEQLSAVAVMKGFHINSDFQLAQANLHNKQGEHQKCLDVLKGAALSDPLNATKYRLAMATAYLGLKDYDASMLWCNKVLSVQGNNPEALLVHAEINQSRGDAKAAKLDYFRAVEFEPKNPEVYEKRGTFFLAHKQFGAASEDLKKAQNLDPSSESIKTKLASCQKQMSLVHGQKIEIDHTKLNALELKEIGSADAQSLRTLGYEALKQSRITYAVAALTRAVSLTPNDPMARRYLAYALIAAQDCSAAIEQFYAWEKLETISPDDEIAFVNSVADTGESDKAKTLIERLASKFSKSSTSLLKLAKLCLKLKFNILGLSVVKAGLKVASPAEKIEFDQLVTGFDHLDQAPSIKIDLNPIGKS
jgi:tetratricopeptide (TPR) repeat protein